MFGEASCNFDLRREQSREQTGEIGRLLACPACSFRLCLLQVIGKCVHMPACQREADNDLLHFRVVNGRGNVLSLLKEQGARILILILISLSIPIFGGMRHTQCNCPPHKMFKGCDRAYPLKSPNSCSCVSFLLTDMQQLSQSLKNIEIPILHVSGVLDGQYLR